MDGIEANRQRSLRMRQQWVVAVAGATVAEEIDVEQAGPTEHPHFAQSTEQPQFSSPGVETHGGDVDSSPMSNQVAAVHHSNASGTEQQVGKFPGNDDTQLS